MLELFILKTNLNMADFLKQQSRYLEKAKVAISQETFEKLWDDCLKQNGKIDFKQPSTQTNKNIGIYNFVYTQKNSDGALEEIKIVIRNAGAKNQPAKRLFLEALSAGDFRFNASKSLLAEKVYIDLHPTLKQELQEGRTL